MLKILSENLRLILIGVIAILMVAAGTIVLSLYFGGDLSRKLTVSEISGTVYVTRDGKRLNAAKKSVLQSGDVITTDENSSLRISFDSGKYIWVEPDTSLYIYFTGVASKGNVSVNLTKGAVVCQLNNELTKKETFSLKTPNSSIAVKGTVFRTEFNYEEEYNGYGNVMITEVQNFDGTVSLQLYDAEKQPVELPMVLIERTSAQMITADEMCKYGYLNYSFDLLSLSDITLGELIKARTETELAFSVDELNNAYKTARSIRLEQENATETVTEESTEETTSVTTVTTTETTTTTVPPTETETEESTSYGTLSTTLQTHEYTTYTGIKWWEITGNSNTGTEGYEDWFSEPDGVSEEEASVTTTVPNDVN